MAHLTVLCRHLVAGTRRLYDSQTQARCIKRWVAPTLRELEHRKQKSRGGQRPVSDPRSTYLEWNYDAEVYAFAKRLKEDFQEHLLKQAFTHRSYMIKQELATGKPASGDQEEQDNTQLIKEGEAIIADCINRHLRRSPPGNADEEEVVSAVRSHLTSMDTLAHIALHLGVKDLILSSDYPVEKRTAADTFKAIVAALRHSTDLERAQIFVKDFVLSRLNGRDVQDDLWKLEDPYRYLLRLAAERGYAQIEPRLCNRSAVNTVLANYRVGLYCDKRLLGIGWGESVKIAKSTAALDAIEKLRPFRI